MIEKKNLIKFILSSFSPKGPCKFLSKLFVRRPRHHRTTSSRKRLGKIERKETLGIFFGRPQQNMLC
jgi:hypothetical protein